MMRTELILAVFEVYYVEGHDLASNLRVDMVIRVVLPVRKLIRLACDTSSGWVGLSGETQPPMRRGLTSQRNSLPAD